MSERRERFLLNVTETQKRGLEEIPHGSRGAVVRALIDLALGQVKRHRYAAIFAITEGRAKLIIPKDDREAGDI